MIVIGKPYLEKEIKQNKTFIKLCSDVSITGLKSDVDNKRTLYFSVEEEYGQYLTFERGDAFVTALLYFAINMGMDIKSEVAVSKRFLYWMNSHFIPCLAKQLGKQPVKVIAEATDEILESAGAVGTGYSGGVDSLYTVMQHTKGIHGITEETQYRHELTHLCVINAGVFEGSSPFDTACRLTSMAEDLGRELNLKAVLIDTNLHIVLDESYLEVLYFRIYAAVLSLQKLFDYYLSSSGHGFENFRLGREFLQYQDLLNIQAFRTENLVFKSVGSGVRRVDKIKSLCDFEPSYTRMHPCFRLLDKNCGHCKKCRHDIVALHALGELDRFDQVFDVADARKNMDIHVAFLIANSKVDLCSDVLELMEENGIEISRRSKLFAQQFKKGMENIKNDMH